MLLKLALERAVIYRRDLAFYVAGWAAFTVLLMVFWYSVLGNFMVLAFTEAEALSFIGMYYIAWGLSSFLWGIRDLHIRIVDGTIDVYLTRPINPIIPIVLLRSHIGVIMETLTGLALILIAIPRLSSPPLPIDALFSAFFLFGGVSLWAPIYGVLSLTSFSVGRMERSLELMDYGYEYTYYPMSFMPASMRDFLTWFLPLAFLVTFPTLSLLGKLTADFQIQLSLGESSLILIWGSSLAYFSVGA